MSKRHPAPTLAKPLIRDLTFHRKSKATGMWTIIPHNTKAREFLFDIACKVIDGLVMKDDGSEGVVHNNMIGTMNELAARYDLQVSSKLDLP